MYVICTTCPTYPHGYELTYYYSHDLEDGYGHWVSEINALNYEPKKFEHQDKCLLDRLEWEVNGDTPLRERWPVQYVEVE